MSGSPATPMFVDLTDPALEAPSQDVLPGVVVALCPGAPPESAAPWLDHATFTLTEEPTADRRVVQVDSIDSAVAAITENVASRPLAAAVCDDVLRADSARAGTLSGLITESLAYSTLQAGPEFIEWLAGQGPVKCTSKMIRYCSIEADRRSRSASTGLRGTTRSAMRCAQG